MVNRQNAYRYVRECIAKENRLPYFNALEAYAVEGRFQPFADMIAGLVEIQLDRYLGMAEQNQFQTM